MNCFILPLNSLIICIKFGPLRFISEFYFVVRIFWTFPNVKVKIPSHINLRRFGGLLFSVFRQRRRGSTPLIQLQKPVFVKRRRIRLKDCLGGNFASYPYNKIRILCEDEIEISANLCRRLIVKKIVQT